MRVRDLSGQFAVGFVTGLQHHPLAGRRVLDTYGGCKAAAHQITFATM
ncbi:hypothetical protein [Streptomyces sp. MST-110588]|nr:hypothetical protein [Streptomyces sp. MST-110588]UNO42145.1 hypothetical protein KGS77_24810 [Streptomyces sp. MST-110588]